MSVNKEWDSDEINYFNSVEKIQKQLRKGNWTYLSEHPEIRAIIRLLLTEAVNEKPDNIYDFAAKLFDCNNGPMLGIKINQQLKRVNALLKESQWNEFDGEMLFSKTESTHSLLSETSVNSDVNCILKYSMVMPEDRDAPKDA